jgi:hypothetical protein
MADYTVTITVAGTNFSYDPGYLQVHRGDRVRFSCNQAFTIKFSYDTPFEKRSGFYQDAAITTGYETIDSEAALQAYHYHVAALDPATNIIHFDAGCPTIEVS